MGTSISNRVARLRQRRCPAEQTSTFHGSTKVGGIGSPPVSTPIGARDYMLQSCAPVDDAYTTKTFSECNRVANQLSHALAAHAINVEFDRQGSVTNNTHIRHHSDVDLLVLPQHFRYVKAPLIPQVPYRGNAIHELLTIRAICHESLDKAYPTADVDGDGNMAVSISGGSLARKVDVVAATWLDTAEYATSAQKTHRGICVLDVSVPQLVENFPFKHNAAIDSRDQQTYGQLRRLIRLMKCIRSDSDKEPDVSSYHVASLCFHFPRESYDLNPTVTLRNLITWTCGVLRDAGQKATLHVPNGTEVLFARIKDGELLNLLEEANDLLRLAA